jgi:hypothetical protein
VFRITTITAKGSPALKLEGNLGGPWVDELQNCGKDAAARAHGKTIQIDMRGVSYVDQRGRNLLLRMEGEGAALAECSDFIRQMLDAKDGHQKVARKITKKVKKENEHASTVRT